jgi:hypothetical protein
VRPGRQDRRPYYNQTVILARDDCLLRSAPLLRPQFRVKGADLFIGRGSIHAGQPSAALSGLAQARRAIPKIENASLGTPA